MPVPPSPGAVGAVVTETVTIAGRALEIAHPRSADELIDEAEYERDERLPYWADLWPSAHVLAAEVAGMDLAGRSVLELGCGVALPAVVAARGGARVLATDWYAPALEFAEANAAANDTRLRTLLVDWRDPPADLLSEAPFDVVIGADVLYEERNGVALAGLLPELVGPSTEVLIADPRRPHAAELLDRLTAGGWSHVAREVRHSARVDESGPVVRLHALTPPGGAPARRP